MSRLGNFIGSLTDEIIAEMAEGFFGRRARLEAQIDTFRLYVERFRATEKEVVASAGFLNFLLLGPAGSRQFYRSIGVKGAAGLIESPVTEGTSSKSVPRALTKKRQFTKLVLWAYDDLKTICDEHMHGHGRENLGDRKDNDTDLSYDRLRTLHQTIEDETRRVNAMSMADHLQAFRHFSMAFTETEWKERILDVGPKPYSNIDHRFAYTRIDFDSLRLKRYPDLPHVTKTQEDIRSFCRAFYGANREAARSVLSHLTDSNRPLVPPRQRDS